MSKSRVTAVCLLAIVVAATVLVPGCARRTTERPTAAVEPSASVEPTEPAPSEPSTAPEEATRVTIYFVRDEKLGAASRQVVTESSPSAWAAAAIEQVLQGPSAMERAAGLRTAVPTGTELNGVTIDDGVATIDVSSAFASGGGSLSMQLRVAQMVFTVDQFPEIDKVAFKVDGESVTAIGGEGVIVDPPVDRADFEDQLPAIMLEKPTPGATVSNPAVSISGTANVFEAQFNAKITDADGTVLGETRVTASSGTGTRGDFSAAIDFDRPNRRPDTPGGYVIVYDISEKDGSVIDEVKVPVRFE
jgi:spore germination protein GerM